MESNKTASEHFNDGVRYALVYLRDEVYGDEITQTSIWRDFALEYAYGKGGVILTCSICGGTRLVESLFGDRYCSKCGEPEYNFQEVTE